MCLHNRFYTTPNDDISKEDVGTGQTERRSIPQTLFVSSESCRVNDLFVKWFEFFLKCIPAARSILLIQDGHSFHVSIQLIKMARENNVCLLCLPAHTSYIPQPFDVGVFK